MILRRVFGIALLALIQLAARTAFAADKCVEAGDKGYQQINTVYDPKLQLFMKISGALKEKGFDPKRYPYVTPQGGVEPVDLVDLVTKLAIQKSSGYKQVAKAVDECNKGFAVPQKITDAAVFFATGGLSAVLPARLTHVDVSQLLSNTPFGGPDALIPKLRDDVLNGLGIGGDVACIIRDPKKVFGGC
ncbi:hypothetical protein [Bradyrhizobium septentrionale]|uniref:Uncharacterized protein n=1 Tax=Bradyrhizobium septentrionale TaxID=1404411 RepID=A0ABZ2P4W9_9BRAD